jgi:hypothetical protein
VSDNIAADSRHHGIINDGGSALYVESETRHPVQDSVAIRG